MENNEDLKQVGKRNILTSGLISTYPFISSSIVEEKGIYIGNNMYNNSLILIDRYNTEKYKNANMCIFGTSGAGKSFYTKLLILRNLLTRPWRFNELKKNLDGISQKVLTDSLRSMEEDGLITRTVFPEVPPHVEYALSDLGETMRPILDAMKEWGTWYKENC